MSKSISYYQKEVFRIATLKGWHEKNNPFGQTIANIHSEVSEAWEWWRNKNPSSDHIPEFSGIEEEFADVILRILDAAVEMELDIEGAMAAKLKYNEARAYKHGGKLA